MAAEQRATRQAAFFRLNDLEARREALGPPYLEFLREEALSAGLYVLSAGAEDLQKPHTEDEIYIVMSGAARFRAANEDRAVGPGDVLYVRRTVEHRFHSVTRELKVLVMFAPAEGSAGQ